MNSADRDELDISTLENVTGGTRCAFMPIGVPVPETMAVSLTFYGREEKDGRDFIGPMPLRTRKSDVRNHPADAAVLNNY